MAEAFPQPIQQLVGRLLEGDRHPVEDADSIEVRDDLDLALHHQVEGYEVILRYTIWTSWHDSDGQHSEFDLLDVQRESVNQAQETHDE